jgi:hypothetical protein
VEDGLPRYRSFIWGLERFLVASSDILDAIGQNSGETQTDQLKKRVDSIGVSLIKAEGFIREYVGAGWDGNTQPEFLEPFFEGRGQLEQFFRTADVESFIRARECFTISGKRLDYMLSELGNNPGGSSGAGWPAPLSPKPTLSAKDARRYPPVG